MVSCSSGASDGSDEELNAAIKESLKTSAALVARLDDMLDLQRAELQLRKDELAWKKKQDRKRSRAVKRVKKTVVLTQSSNDTNDNSSDSDGWDTSDSPSE